MKKLILFTLIFFYALLVTSQESNDDMTMPKGNHTKNLIYSNAEFYLLGGGVNINYERFIFAAKKFDFSLKGTYGRWTFGGGLGEGGPGYGNLVKLTGNMLFLKGNNHLEIGVGAMLLMNDKEPGIQSVIPDLFCGYTYRKPDGHLVFKAGLGILGFLSVGMGYAF